MSVQDEDTDDRSYLGRKCFVVMPFGEKIDTADLAGPSSAATRQGATIALLPGAQVTVIDFDRIFETLIAPAVKDAAGKVKLDIECIRSDKVARSGFIHREMLELVTGADIAIVDITTQNANVFYELGVRHSFRRATTILIQREGTHIPFNISGMRVFPYSDDATPDAKGHSPLLDCRAKLAEIIAGSVNQKENDSLVHHLLPNTSVVREGWPIMERRYVWYDILDRDGKRITRTNPEAGEIAKSIGFITGDVLNIKDVDVWVNPENTKMQMARFHDGSVSSNIRYYGAKRAESGQVIEDTIAIALQRCMGTVPSVEPGVVFATVSGTLAETNNVKLIMHVAALQGEPGKGYQPIRDYPGCVRRSLAEIDRLNALPPVQAKRGLWPRRQSPALSVPRLAGRDCASVLFPLFGTRSFGQNPQSVTENLFRAAVVYLEQHPASRIDTVYFLAFTEQDQELCERALGLLESNRRITQSQSGRTPEGDIDTGTDHAAADPLPSV